MTQRAVCEIASCRVTLLSPIQSRYCGRHEEAFRLWLGRGPEDDVRHAAFEDYWTVMVERGLLRA